MALDTYTDVWGKVLLRVPGAGKHLAEDWVKNAFRRVAERRQWSWLIKRGQFIMPTSYNAGTAVVTQGLTTVTGTATAWTAAMIGRQFRAGASPVYTIAAWNGAGSIELDAAWGDASNAAVTYEIYQCYVAPPSDFHHFITLWDPALNWQLSLNYSQKELNFWDSQRAWAGNAYLVAALDYSGSQIGTVGAVLQVAGAAANPDPGSGGVYTGAADGVFVIECTLGGVSGVATFRWKKDTGAYTAGVVSDVFGNNLQDGVIVYWPLVVNYVAGDVWIIQAKEINSPGVPRYELWPHQKAARVYPYLYCSRAVDLDDTGSVLPRHVRGDLLLEMALAEASGTPAFGDEENPYFNIQTTARHDREAERMIGEMERQDDEVYMQDLEYASALPYAIFPGADFWQSHAA